MKYSTICSGIGAPELAWNDLWGKPIFTAEIEKFQSKVLEYHNKDILNYGDINKYKEWKEHELGLICGGTPCQSFSIAGLRKGMDDPRGNLTLIYLGIIAKYNPRWIIWENVPGVLSSISNGQSDFGNFLTGLAKLGYSCAYRVLDAQYFGVPQRRRRVFVVGYIGEDWRPPYAVLFEPTAIIKSDGIWNGECHEQKIIYTSNDARGHESGKISKNIFPTITRGNASKLLIIEKKSIRYATPIEVERAFGFPDNYTLISWKGKSKEECPKSLRYGALGNSMVVPVMKWLGSRIDKWNSINNIKDK